MAKLAFPAVNGSVLYCCEIHHHQPDLIDKMTKPGFPLFAFSILIILLSACGSQPDTATPDRVSTMVAGTLTAAPTWTPPPTVTAPTPFSTKTSTPSPTDTPTPGPSPTPTIPVLPTDDPRFGLDISSPFYWDDFSRSFTWVEWVDEITSHRVTAEHLESIDFQIDSAVWWSTTTPIGGDLYVEVTAEFGDCSGKDFAGVGVRIGEDLSSGYTVEISCDGYYRIRKFSIGFVDILLEWTPSSSVQTGSGADNVLGFVARGDVLSSVINGVPGESVSDPTYHVGTFSLFAGAEQTEGFKVSFDDFKIWFFSS